MSELTYNINRQTFCSLFNTEATGLQLSCYHYWPFVCMPLHNSHHPLSNGYKDIYFSVLMFGLSLILAAKQTLGLNLRVSVMLACSSPTLETRVRVMRLERLTKTNL